MRRGLLPIWVIILLATLVVALLCIMQAAASGEERSASTEAERVFERAAGAVVAVVIPPPPVAELKGLAPGAEGAKGALPEGVELKRTEEGVEIRIDPERFKGELPMAEDRPGPPPAGMRDVRDLRELMERQARAAQIVPRRPGPELSAGFLIDADGHILTFLPSEFPVDEVRVEWMDGTKEQCRVVGRDQVTGLCLVKSQRDDLPAPLGWGDSDALRVGSAIYTIAHPEGFRHSLGVGVVAGLDRKRRELPYLGGLIQTTLEVRPGTMGAPLLDADGEVVGVRTSSGAPRVHMPGVIVRGGFGGDGRIVEPIASPPQIDLAIPASQVRDPVEQLRAHGKVRRAWLGVQISEVSAEKREAFHLPAELSGVLIVRVLETTPADAAGLRDGDIVLAIDGQPLANATEMVRTVQSHKPADRVTISIWREGERRQIIAVLGDQPEQL